MTTIVTDGRSMASDSLSTCDSIRVGSATRKLFHLPDGSVVGISGQTKDAMEAVEALSANKEHNGEFTILRLFIDGSVLRYDGSTFPIEQEVPVAIGTGWEIALGAIGAGANPKRAVEIAATRDIYTGGDVTVLRPRKPKR